MLGGDRKRSGDWRTVCSKKKKIHTGGAAIIEKVLGGEKEALKKGAEGRLPGEKRKGEG